jgi:hypothetical protein
LKRSAPIRRYTPVRHKRPTARRGEPTREEKAAIRKAVYERSGGRCELRDDKGAPLDPRHISGVLPPEGDVFYRWHLVHIHAKRRFGWGLENLTGGCYWCHAASHNCGNKPCPPKERA